MINIRADAAKMLKAEFGIPPETTAMLFEKGIIREPEMKKVLLREEYLRSVGRNGKQVLRNKLASKYCVSVSLVEKTVL